MGQECEGRVALVTGASQGGTGTAVAVRLAAEGADVAVTARSVDGLRETAARIEGLGRRALVLPCDLGDPNGGRDALVARTEAELGPLDVLVNNAAAGGYKPFEEWTDHAIDRMLQVNLLAPWRLMRDAVPGMRTRGRGWIVNVTTFAAELPPGPPFPTNRPAKSGSGYGAPKAALNRLTVQVASECEGQGIAVNALSPQAAIATPQLLAGGWIADDYFEPLETMAEAALALCTADPSVLTGRIAYSLQLLAELGRPVHDLEGGALVDGWQPADLPSVIARQAGMLADVGWADPFRFGRVHSPAAGLDG
ncbi:MAG: SDR family oxidoreductase [Acidimicrobiia bacterium]|jgi:NAD(P)-dependent dehydrogenase (short-subunit alcohol dehydrogenase family)